MKIVIIGGGIIGLSSAYYLRQAGHEATVLDKGDMLDGCSYGNMGAICCHGSSPTNHNTGQPASYLFSKNIF